MLFVSELLAVHGSISATREARKKCEKAQDYETYMKENPSL